MQTPRNQIKLNGKYIYTNNMLAEIDTVYEIADAEFTSDADIVAYWEESVENGFIASWQGVIFQKIEMIAAREQLVISCKVRQVKESIIESISDRIVEDWHERWLAYQQYCESHNKQSTISAYDQAMKAIL